MAIIDGPLDANGRVQVGLPTDMTTPVGAAQLAYKLTPTIGRIARVSEQGELHTTLSSTLFNAEFNGAAAGTIINSQFNPAQTTMTATMNSGFFRFNASGITTVNTGFAIATWATFSIQDGSYLKASMPIRHTFGSVANKQFDFGFGYYDIAAGQAASMNEFAGFRWTQAGELKGILEYSVGGAATTLECDINAAAAPFSDSIARTYELLISESGVEFWVDGIYYNRILSPADAPGPFKAHAYPVVTRLFNGASPPPTAPVFESGGLVVHRIGAHVPMDLPTTRSFQGRNLNVAQSGVQTTSGATSITPASGTAPTGVTATNATPALAASLGGAYRLNGAAITATAHTEYMINVFTNPAVPETAGAANNGRSFVVTDIFISAPVVTTALTGGGFTANWFLFFGSTGALNATDAVGGATVGTKVPKRLHFPITDTVAAAAAVGTVVTRVGDGRIHLNTPIVVAPSETLGVAIRTIVVGAAVTAGTMDGFVGYNGYWL